MKEPRLEPDSPAHGVISYDARIAADTDVSASSYASTVSAAPLETLEVHDQPAKAQVSAPMTDNRFKAPFSRRKAAVVSSIITVLVILLTVVTLAILSREAKQPNATSRLNLSSQDIELKNQSNATAPAELQGAGSAVLINGDLITRGQLKVTNGAYLTVLRSANLTSNRNLTLPNASGTLCVDSNNCGYATTAQLQDLQSRLGQIVVPTVPDATTVNGLGGAVSVQGTSNQISVTTANGVIALSTPQDIAPISSPTFANLLLNGNFSVAGTVTLPLNCSGMLNGGALTTNASGQIICSADDSTSGGGGSSVSTPGGSAGNLALFTAADTIADSVISQALGAITIGGNTSVSGTLSANSLTLATALSVANGGTGATTFTTNGVLLGNGTSAVGSTAAPAAGQLLIGNVSNVPEFTTISGDVAITAAGVTAIQADSVVLGVDTSGNYVRNLGALTGLSTTGNTGEASTPTLSVVYGSAANTSVQGNTSISVTAGTNLTGGGSITLGNGGTVTLNVTNSPTFSGNVIAQGGTITLGTTSTTGYAVLHDGNGQIGSLTMADLTAGRTYTFPDATGTVCLSTGNCVGGSGGAPNGATYLTIGNNATLTNERSITAGSNISFTDGGANGTFTIDTVNNPSFATSVSTPLLQSSGALSITPNGALTVGATGQTALLQGSTTTITSNGAGNDIVLTSADQIRLTGFNCTTYANGGVLTTDVSGNITCADDDGGAGGALTGTGTNGRIALFTGSQTMADSWLLQNGSTLELDNTRNLSLLGGNLSVTGTGGFSGLLTASGGLTVTSGQAFTVNGDAFTDLTGTGLVISSGSLQTTLGTSVDLASEITGTLDVTNGGTGVNGSAAANGQLLIGNGTGYTLATLTQGAGITITNGSGSITVANAFGSSIDLGTETTGNYQAGTTGGNGISVSGTAGAGWTAGVALGDLTSNWTQNGAFDVVLNNANSQLKVLESAGGTFFGTIDVGDLTADRTYTFPDASGTICLSTGNCAGAGGGVTGSGTADTIAKFTGSGTIGDSSISDDGSVVTLNGTANLVVQGGTATFGTLTQAGTLTISDGSSNTVSIVASAFAGNQTYTLPDVGGAATFCMSTGNCVGGGGGGAPNAAAYLVASLDGTLTNERALAAGSNVSITDGGAGGNFTVATVQNPTFTTSVTTPLLQSSGVLTLTSAAGQVIAVDAGTTIELQDSTNVTGSVDISVALNVGTSDAFQVSSSGAIAAATGITSSGSVTFSALNCTTFTNGGKLTTNGSGQLTCANDSGAAAGTVTGSGTNGTLPMFTATNVIADSIVTQSGTTVSIAGDLTLSTALSVANGGTGAVSFTANGVLYGNNTGALQATSAGTSGQVLVANASGVPAFVSFSGDVLVSDTGVTTIQANSVTLGTDTTGNYIRNLGTLTGLSTTGNTGEAATPTLSVDYGSTANTAVQGNTQLTCASGTGNLSGGGTVITLGTGGTCAALDTVANPTFATSVTTPELLSVGSLNITPGGALTIGATSQTFTLQGNASSAITATGNGFVTTVGFTGTATGAVTYQFDRAAAPGTYTICTTVGNCTGTAVTLQSAYNNSTNPELVLDATRGALTIRDNVSPLGTNLLEVQSNDGSTTYLAVKETGADITGNLNVMGTGVPSDTTLVVRGNGAKGDFDLIADFQSYDGVTTKTIFRVTNNAGLYVGNNTGTAGLLAISNGSKYGTLQTTNLTNDRTFELPDVSGTICTSAGNCGSTTGTLQAAYNYSAGGTTPEIKLNNPQTALDVQDADVSLGSSANFLSFRGSNASGLGSLLVGFGIQGNLYMNPSADRTDFWDINDQGGNNLFTLDSSNKRVGINLGGSTLPSYNLDVTGTANISTSLLVPSITRAGVATANGTGGNVNVAGGDATSNSCGTACTGGNLSLQGGNATGSSGTRNGGSVVIDAGTGATSNGNINIGTNTSANVTIGRTTGGATVTLQAGSGGVILEAGGASTTGIIQIGAGGAGSNTPDYLALDVKSTTGDPAGGAEGYMYYNTFDNKFRCYQGSGWVDCISPTGASTTLQQAYDASANPELVLDATRGALTIRDNVSPIGGNLLEVQNNSGSTSYLAVSATGTSVAGTLSVTGTINGSTLNSAGASTIVWGTTQDLTLAAGNGSGSGAVVLTGSSPTIKTTGSSGLSVTSAGSLSLSSAAGSNVYIDGGNSTSQVQIGNTNAGLLDVMTNAVAHSINIGTSPSAAQTLSMGSINAGSTITLRGGTGTSAVSIQSGGSGKINIATTNVSNTVQIGNTANAVTQTIGIGNNATAGSTNTVTLGSLIGTSATTIQGGTGNINLNVNQAGAGVIVKTATNDSSTAFQVQKADGNSVLVVDTANGWVINNGSTHPGNLIENPSFEGGTGFTASGWNFGGQSTIATDSTNAHSGNKVLATTPNGSLIVISSYKYLAVAPGDQFYAEIWYKTAVGTDGGSNGGSFSFTYYDKDKVNVGSSSVTNFNAANNSYTRATVSGTVPAGAAYVRLSIAVNSTSTTGTWYMDDFYVAKTSEQVPQLLKNSVDSTTAFQIQNATAEALLTANTTSGLIQVGSATTDASAKLLVLDSFNGADESSFTGAQNVNGAMYYNSNLGKFRCRQGGTWVDCVSPTGASTTLQQAYNFSTGGTTPEITLDSTRGALTVRDSSTPLGANLLEVQNNAGSTTYLAVASTGLTVNTALSAGAGGTGNSITSNISTTSGMVTGNRLDTALNPASNSSADVIGTSNTISTSGTANFSGDLIASLGQINWAGSGTSSDRLMGSVGKVAASGGSGAIGTAVGVLAEGQFQGGAVTNYYGLYSTMNALNSVAVQNAYGLKIDNFAAIGSAAPTNFYAIAADGGMTRLTGSSAYQFQVQNAALTPVLNVDTTTSNLVTNPSVEFDTTGWSAAGSATISKSAAITPYDANFALRIDSTAAAGDGAKFSYNLAGSTQYTLSFFIKAAAGTSFGTLQAGRSDNGSTDTACTLSPDPTGFGAGVNDLYWKRYTCTFTTGAVSGSRYIYIKQTDATARTFYIDAVQLETGASATIYRSGKTALGGNLVVNGGQPEAGASDVTLKVNVMAGGHGLIVKASGANDLFKSLIDVRNADDTISYFNINEVTRGTSIRGGNSAFSAAALEVTSIQDAAVALKVNAASGQTADIFQVYDAAGTPNKLLSVGVNNVTIGNATNNTALTLQSGTGTIDMGTGAQARAINIGTGAASQTVTVGSQNTTSTTTVQGGTGGITLQTAGTTTVTSSATGLPTMKIQQTANSTTGGRGLLIVGGTNPGENVFEIQNSSTTPIFSVDSSNSRTTIGSGTSCTGRLCVGQTSTGSGLTGNVTTTNLYNIQSVSVSLASGTRTYVGQNIVINDTSTAQSTVLQPLIIDTTGSTNANAQVNAIQVQGRAGAAGTFIQLQNGATDVLNVNNTGATTFRMVSGSDSATAFRIQDGSAASLFTVDTTARSASGGNLIKIGNSSKANVNDVTFLQLDAVNGVPTTGLVGGALDGSLFYNSTTGKVSLIENGQVKVICNTTDLGCGTGTITQQIAYTNSTGGTTPEVLLDSTRNGFDIQDANSTIGGSQALFAVRGSASATTLGSAYLQVVGDGRVGVGGISAGTALNVVASTGVGGIKSVGGDGTPTTTGIGGTGGFGLQATGGIGGAATGTGGFAGYGGTINLTGGAGGAATGTSANGGYGGDVSLTGGAGGASSLYIAGSGGNLALAAGNGGDSSSGNANTGGNGGNVTITAGNGGGTGAINAGGTAGSITLQAGTGGISQPGGDVNIIAGGSALSGSGGSIVLTPGTSAAIGTVQIGSKTVDSTQYNLVLDSSTAFSDSGTCSASVNPGALYFSNLTATSTVSGTGAIRACVPSTAGGGGWQDVVTTDALGTLLFGVVPDSGSNKGDIAALGTAGLTGPCKVSAATATTVRIESCVAYTQYRRVAVAQNTSFTIPVGSGWTRICLTGAGYSVEAVNAASETSMPSFMAPGPQLCLAHIATDGTKITQVYDTRTFTTTQKEFYTVESAVSIGQIVTIGSTTKSAVRPVPSGGTLGKILGVVVATSGATSTTSPRALVATSGPAWVKATAGTLGDYVQSSNTTAGYVNTLNTVPSAINEGYASLGLARNAFASGSCSTTPSATNCVGSLFVVLNIR